MQLVEGPMLPCVRRLTAADLPFSLTVFSLLYVTEGELLLREPEGAHRLAAGELLALRSGTARLEQAGGRATGEALWLQSSPEWVAQACALFGAATLRADAEPLVREPSGSELARRAARLLTVAHLDAGPEAGERAGFEHAGRLAELVGIGHSMAGSLVAPRPASGRRAHSSRARLVRVLEELETADLDGFTLGVLAERVGLSRRHASRLLKQEVGASFPEYLTALRIERAKKLLTTTGQPVTEVALETGWQSLSHFNTVFRRRVGVTPSAWRARAIARVEPPGQEPDRAPAS